MTDYNDGLYRDPTRTSLYPEAPPYARQSGAYPVRRAPRYSRNSNAPSWVSQGVLVHSGGGSYNGAQSYAGVPSTPGSRPLPVPSPAPSRGMSDFQPVYPSPSELGPEPEPESHHSSYPGPPSEPREERDYDGEENMTIGQSMDEYEYVDHAAPQQQSIPEHSQYPYHPPAPRPVETVVVADPGVSQEPEPVPKSRTRNFVGGFVASLRRLPAAVVWNNFNDRRATRKGAPGADMAGPSGSSHFLPAYDDPGTTVTDPTMLQYVSGVDPSAAPKSPTEVSPVDRSRHSSHPSRRVSQPLSHLSHRSSSRANTGSLYSPRFVPADPVTVDPLPASDYAKMDSPIRFAPPDTSFSEHISRVQRFFHDVKNLPWTSERVALDYEPSRSHRAHTGKDKAKGSWYAANKHQDIDLLAGPLPPSARQAAAFRLRTPDGATDASMRSVSRAAAPHPHDMRTPMGSYMTSPGMVSSPGASSHGMGQHQMSYSYYFAPPQPLYVYPSPMTSPLAQPPLGGTDSSSSSGMVSPDLRHQQAVPVYMMAGPPPGLLASHAAPPPAHPAPERMPSPRVTITPANVPLPQSPMPSRSRSHQSHLSGTHSH